MSSGTAPFNPHHRDDQLHMGKSLASSHRSIAIGGIGLRGVRLVASVEAVRTVNEFLDVGLLQVVQHLLIVLETLPSQKWPASA